jgi:HK97 gp10 family phage protein
MREFDGFGALAQHFETVMRRLPATEKAALSAIGAGVAERARAKIGNYQDAAGGFPAWPPLAPATRAEKERLGYAPPDNPLLRTGDLRESITHTVVEKTVTVGATDPVGLWQELGTSRIPPRPFIAPAMVEAMPQNVRLLGTAVRDAFERSR